MFWYGWSSWVTELLSGVLLMLVLSCWLGPWPALPAGLVLSGIYERYLDRNGWSWTDVSQRAVGMLVGVGIVLLRRQLP